MYVFNRYLNTGSVLHIKHTDVRYVGEDLYILKDRLTHKLVLGANKEYPSLVYYKGISLNYERWLQVNGLLLKGDFSNQGDQADQANQNGNQADEDDLPPMFQLSSDDGSFNVTERFYPSQYSSVELGYTGIARGMVIDLMIPFSGLLNAVLVKYNK
jgi:hypothetical protein